MTTDGTSALQIVSPPASEPRKFNPDKYLTDLRGKQYLEVKWRQLWFRTEHPGGSIQTEMLSVDPIIFKATILNENGTILATGHGSATSNTKAVWSGREVEKAETAAIGRALASAGYGTQFTGEDESDNIVDSPAERATGWATEKNLNTLLASARQTRPSLSQAEFCDAAGIDTFTDASAWQDKFATGKDAGIYIENVLNQRADEQPENPLSKSRKSRGGIPDKLQPLRQAADLLRENVELGTPEPEQTELLADLPEEKANQYAAEDF